MASQELFSNTARMPATVKTPPMMEQQFVAKWPKELRIQNEYNKN